MLVCVSELFVSLMTQPFSVTHRNQNFPETEKKNLERLPTDQHFTILFL